MEIKKDQVIRLTPVYGYGWFLRRDNKALMVPEPFELSVVEFNSSELGTYLVGQVVSDQDEFANLGLVLSLRTGQKDRIDWNVEIFESVQTAFDKIAGGSSPYCCTGFGYTKGV